MGNPETKATLGHGIVQEISCLSHICFKHIINYENNKTQMDSILNAWGIYIKLKGNLDANKFSYGETCLFTKQNTLWFSQIFSWHHQNACDFD
jgi:hypothetical protein